MAATTLATSLALIGDTVLRELVTEFFVKPDPWFRRMPFVVSPGGWQWVQRYTSEPDGGAPMVITDTMTPSAFTEGSYSEHLKLAYKMDQRNMAVTGMGEGQQGISDRLTKKKHILAALSKYVRQKVVDGAPSTTTVGATLAALLGTGYAVVASPRTFTFSQATAGTVTYGRIKWVLATKTISYMAPGDTKWGPGVVLSATNYFRVPLFSGGLAADGDKNYHKWIWITVHWGTISIAGDYTSTADTALECIVFTPNKQMTGLYTHVHPDQVAWHDLTIPGGGSMPPVSGGSPNRENLTWMAQKLLDASNDNPSRCAMLADDYLCNALEGVITSLGASVPATMFMGEELRGVPSYKGIVILRNRFIPRLTAADGSTSTRNLLGCVVGEDGVHAKYTNFVGDPVLSNLSNFGSGLVAQDETGNTALPPVQYWEDKDAPATLVVDMFGLMIMELVVAGVNKAAMICGLNA